MNTDFIRLAYERTVAAACRRYLMEKYLEGGGGQKETLVCEEVAFNIREVPSEMIVMFIQRLEAEEKRLTEEMAKYEFRKRDEQRPIAQPAQPVEHSAADGGEAAKSRRAGRKPRGEQQGAG
jgi:hypothetical protein